jgi:hypothetical protein
LSSVTGAEAEGVGAGVAAGVDAVENAVTLCIGEHACDNDSAPLVRDCSRCRRAAVVSSRCEAADAATVRRVREASELAGTAAAAMATALHMADACCMIVAMLRAVRACLSSMICSRLTREAEGSAEGGRQE